MTLSTLDIVRKELDVLGSRNNCGVFGEAVDLTLANAESVRRLISETFPLAETQQAMEHAIDHADDVEKVMISI